MRHLYRGFVTSVRTLSAIPIIGRDAENLAGAIPFFPVVGLLIGGILWGVSRLLECIPIPDWSSGHAAILVLLGMVLTRGIHLDGLADTADGFFSMANRKKMLMIMKDSRVGTFGVLALIVILGLKWVAVARLLQFHAALWLIPAMVGSRVVMASLASSMSYARAEEGCGAPFVNGARPSHHLASWLNATLTLLIIGPAALSAVGAAVLFMIILRIGYQKIIGGVTGDLLGAASEITETGLLMILAALAPLESHLTKGLLW